MQAEIITPSVFDYLDYRRFLEDWFSSRRIADPKFSVRAFTRKAGLPISNSSFFSKVIAGKRNLTLDLRFKLVKALRLPHSETKYFELLVQFNQSKDAGSKQHFYGELARFRRSKARIIGKEGFEYYARWHYSIVRAFFGLDQRESNPAAIAEKVFPRLDVKEVEDAVRLLLGLGLITRTANGYALKDRHIARSGRTRTSWARCASRPCWTWPGTFSTTCRPPTGSTAPSPCSSPDRATRPSRTASRPSGRRSSPSWSRMRPRTASTP
jgi:uncharacterized protein (TIGR02147 family)